MATAATASNCRRAINRPRSHSKVTLRAHALHSSINPASADFARNAEVMRGLVAELRAKLNQVAGGGGRSRRQAHFARARCWRVSGSISWSIPAPRF